MKLSSAVEKFITDCRIRGLAQQTITGYASDLHLLVSLASVHEADSVIAFTPDLVRTYFLTLSKKGLSMSTLHRRRASLSEFAKWGLRIRYWSEDPMRETPPIKRPKHVPRPFDLAERERLMALELNDQERVMRALLRWTGLRVTPICGIRLCDVSLSPVQVGPDLVVPGTIRAVQKGNKETVKPMLPELYDVVFDYILKRGLKDAGPSGQRDFLLAQKNGRPFRRKSVEVRVRRWGQRAAVEDCTPHRFRHTFGTELLERGVDIRLIQVLMDHADLRSTQIYTRVVDAHAFGAMLKLSSRPGTGAGAGAGASERGAGTPELQDGVLHPGVSGADDYSGSARND
jgi:integrase/recombinase XerD